uniref:Putative secreted protein n=1 Tax=Anopheles darlingi TaxID=43151 RepID=A0A2M4D2X9_ANODA
MPMPMPMLLLLLVLLLWLLMVPVPVPFFNSNPRFEVVEPSLCELFECFEDANRPPSLLNSSPSGCCSRKRAFFRSNCTVRAYVTTIITIGM